MVLRGILVQRLPLGWCDCHCLDTSCGSEMNWPLQRSLAILPPTGVSLSPPFSDRKDTSQISSAIRTCPQPPVPDVLRDLGSRAASKDKAQMDARFTASHSRGMRTLVALKRLARDHHNVHKRHLVIGDAMAVISALSKGRSSSQMATFEPRFARSRTDGCPASGTRHTLDPTIVPISGAQSFQSMWSRSSARTRPVLAPALCNKRHKRAPPQASVAPNVTPNRRAAKRRCLPESLPASSLNPQPSLIRQVALRN